MKKALFSSLIITLYFALSLAPVTTEAIVVSNVNELVSAIENANAGGDKTITVEDGTYTLDNSYG